MNAHGIEQPDELILLSPWVDVTMSNPDIPNFVGIDPMLTVTMWRTSGEAWVGGLPMDDWHVSPINGDLSDLRNITIFVGTRELFYPDDTLLASKLQTNPNVTLVIGKARIMSIRPWKDESPWSRLWRSYSAEVRLVENENTVLRLSEVR